MNIPSNYTNREAFRAFDPLVVAALAPERIEALVDLEEQIEAVNVDPISEAVAQYPDEDFTEDVLALLLELKDAPLAELPNKIDAVAEALIALETDTVKAAEYGIEQLEGLSQSLAKAGIE